MRYLNNWRPVSLLNTDYKILTKALAIRLQKVITKLVDSDQVGYIKNRYIGDNVRTIADLIAFADFSNIEVLVIMVTTQNTSSSHAKYERGARYQLSCSY